MHHSYLTLLHLDCLRFQPSSSQIINPCCKSSNLGGECLFPKECAVFSVAICCRTIRFPSIRCQTIPKQPAGTCSKGISKYQLSGGSRMCSALSVKKRDSISAKEFCLVEIQCACTSISDCYCLRPTVMVFALFGPTVVGREGQRRFV